MKPLSLEFIGSNSKLDQPDLVSMASLEKQPDISHLEASMHE